MKEAQKLGGRGVRVLRLHLRQQRLLGAGAGALDLQKLHAGGAAVWGKKLLPVPVWMLQKRPESECRYSTGILARVSLAGFRADVGG